MSHHTVKTFVVGLLACGLTGCGTMKGHFVSEAASAGLATETAPSPVVTESDLAPLPPAAQRYLRYMGVLGRPRDWSFQLHGAGRFRLKPDDNAWFDVETWQYNTRLDVARLFRMEGRMSGVFPIVARDTYTAGKGRMLGKLFDLVTVADGQGPEFDTGELVTYLNDAVLFAPTFLLGPETAWSPVDEHSFDVALTDHGRTVKARVLLDDQGAVRDFVTSDRYLEDPDDPKHPLIRGEWHTPMEGWQRVDGRAIPTRGTGMWQLKSGPYTYAELTFGASDVTFNVPANHE
ncbi:MAG TPA: DUF6544 family protein [Stenomitos sp.]